MRAKLLSAFENAENEEHPVIRKAWLTFAIVGGGATGVELAGAIAELARFGLKHEFRAIDPASAKIILLHSGPRILPAFLVHNIAANVSRARDAEEGSVRRACDADPVAF